MRERLPAIAMGNKIKRIWRFLVRIDIAAILILVVLLLAALGSCFPQRPPTSEEQSDQLIQWQTGLQARYGKLMDFLSAIGVFQVFRSLPFVGLVSLLTLSTLLCTLDRWKSIWHRVFHQEVICSDAMFDTAKHHTTLLIPANCNGFQPLSGIFNQKGFRLRTAERGNSFHLRGDRNRSTPLFTLISHLGVVLLVLAILLSIGFGWREEIRVGPGMPASLKNREGLQVEYEGFELSQYPDQSISDYEATISLSQAGQQVALGVIRVNEPLAYESMGIYLKGYTRSGEDFTVLFMAVHDPGYVPGIMAGFLLLLGLTVSFNFPHCCLHARIDPDGKLHLAGRANRRAYDFAQEFNMITKEVQTKLKNQNEDGEVTAC
jgi:cytochrome c biogenesis protein